MGRVKPLTLQHPPFRSLIVAPRQIARSRRLARHQQLLRIYSRSTVLTRPRPTGRGCEVLVELLFPWASIAGRNHTCSSLSSITNAAVKSWSQYAICNRRQIDFVAVRTFTTARPPWAAAVAHRLGKVRSLASTSWHARLIRLPWRAIKSSRSNKRGNKGDSLIGSPFNLFAFGDRQHRKPSPGVPRRTTPTKVCAELKSDAPASAGPNRN